MEQEAALTLQPFRAAQLTPVQVSPLKPKDEHFRGGQIGRTGNIICITQAQSFNKALILLWIPAVGIREKEHDVHLIISNPGHDLLRPALIACKDKVDGQASCFCHETTGGCGCRYIVLCENTAVCRAELHHEFLLLVVCHEGDVHFSFPFALPSSR